ncbi:MULE domain-containing protein [Trichonephila clavata]|uniref:MULE domain-containing protein n=1 Tax=Trichonephila clavata TaxID=2740835 RepID=A0A8X6HYK1_TRICU|nr:MULE domain-containing protein [Trichonephila clavata]
MDMTSLMKKGRCQNLSCPFGKKNKQLQVENKTKQSNIRGERAHLLQLSLSEVAFPELSFYGCFRMQRPLRKLSASIFSSRNFILINVNFLLINIIEFVTWKEEENKTMSKYVRQRGSKTLKNGDIMMNYHCCRSGTYKPKGKGVKSVKSQGSAKIGISCPAIIKVTQSTENVVVQYFPNHKNQSTEDYQSLIGQLLLDIREEITVDSGRKMLIEKKDIHNIKRDFNINGYVKRHEVDAVSVKLWTQEMKNNGENCIVFFKEQRQSWNDYGLKDEDFVLIIMTDFQKEIITKYGKNKICIDGTHGLNSYDFNLYSVLVVDEHKNGIPVAFCFSNKSSEDVFRIYFNAIKNAVGIIETTTFMTDDAPAFYNAWSYVMGTVKNVLLCAWHVTRNWHQNLNKIKNPEKRKIVNKALKAVKEELCLETFSKLMKQFIQELLNDSDTCEFGKYFQQNYAKRPEKWAYCYRKGLGINTNMYLESLLKKIKYHYFEGKHVKRLDIAIDSLLKLVRDLIFQRLIKITKRTISSDKLSKIVNSHRLGLEIQRNKIEKLADNEWKIESNHSNYIICKKEEKCHRLCNIKCTACKICIHSYTCSCVDNLIRGNICKHIHKVAKMFLNDTHNEEIQEIYVNQIDILKETFDVLPCSSKSANNDRHESKKRKIESIFALIDEYELTH